MQFISSFRTYVPASLADQLVIEDIWDQGADELGFEEWCLNESPVGPDLAAADQPQQEAPRFEDDHADDSGGIGDELGVGPDAPSLPLQMAEAIDQHEAHDDDVFWVSQDYQLIDNAQFLAWDAVTDATGYKVWWDTLSGPPYANFVDVGNVLSIASSSSLPGIGTGLRYLNVTPYDLSGLDGAYGVEVTKTV